MEKSADGEFEETLNFKENLVKLMKLQQQMHKSNLILNISNIIISILIYILLIVIFALK